jgi:RNA polymerase sigma factor (sigma-70 family)
VPKSGPCPAEMTNITIEALSEQYLPKVWQYIYYWVKNDAIAEGLTIAVLKKAINGYRSGDTDQEAFQSWLFGAARQTVANCLHQKSGKQTRLKFNLISLVTGRPGAGVIQEDKYNDFGADKAILTQEEREVISLKLVAGLNNRCIARILGLSEPAVGTLIYQALSKHSIESEH